MICGKYFKEFEKNHEKRLASRVLVLAILIKLIDEAL